MKQPLAIFDIDGTIFRSNLHFELISQLVWMKVFPEETRAQLIKLYSRWLEHEGTYGEYRDALVKLYAENIQGVAVETVQEASRKMIEFHKKRTYIFAERLIKHLREKGYYIIAVSGSPDEAVQEYNRSYLHFDRAYGTVYESKEGKYTGREEKSPVKNKGEFVADFMARHGFNPDNSYGIGDTASDTGFLKLVEKPIAFNPDSELKAVAEVNNWPIKVERKDVVYDIV